MGEMQAELELQEGCLQDSCKLDNRLIDDENLQVLLKGEILLQQIKEG